MPSESIKRAMEVAEWYQERIKFLEKENEMLQTRNDNLIIGVMVSGIITALVLFLAWTSQPTIMQGV